MLTLKTNLKREKKIDQSKIPQSFNAIQTELPFLQLAQQDKRLRSQRMYNEIFLKPHQGFSFLAVVVSYNLIINK